MKLLITALVALCAVSCTDLVLIDEVAVESLVLDDNATYMEADDLPQLGKWLPDVWISQFNCSAGSGEGITLYEGESYALGAILEYETGLNWAPQVAFYLSKDTLIDINTSEGHLYTDWLTPTESWNWCGAPYSCNVREAPAGLASNQLYINPTFWTSDPDAFGKLYGEWYLIAVADQRREVRERAEGNNTAFIKVTVLPIRQD